MLIIKVEGKMRKELAGVSGLMLNIFTLKNNVTVTDFIVVSSCYCIGITPGCHHTPGYLLFGIFTLAGCFGMDRLPTSGNDLQSTLR